MAKTTNMQLAARNIGSILLLTSLASSVILCAPGQQQQQQQSNGAAPNANQKLQASSSIQSSGSPVATTTSAAANGGQANNGARQLSSVATELSNMPSLVSLRDASSAADKRANDELETFDGKNPFTDDSLWQIPIHFAQELSPAAGSPSPTGSNDNMAKSASEHTAAADEHDDELGDGDSIAIGNILEHQQQQRPSGAASAPAVISASTADLKTAAGYHHATPHHYGHGHGYGGHHHDLGHYGGHHGGHYGGAGHHDAGHYGGHHDHYGGKYFQYASVPYPYAWDFGYRRGNPYHTIERYEHGKGPHFQTKVKWSDKHGGYGVHVWDYNHDDHSKHHYDAGHHGHGGHHGYDAHGPSHHYGGHHGHH